MTYSLIARDPDSGRFAVAVATCHLAVGAFVPHARAGVGAAATQADTNPMLGPHSLERMAAGLSAPAALEAALAEDPGRVFRQVHLIDRRGATGAWTGVRTGAVAAHRSADGVSVAGNLLAGEAVLDAVLAQWRRGARLPWPERLVAALRAGEDAGGDRRGRQSAALLIQGGEPYADLDLRVDHAEDPLAELECLVAEARKPYVQALRAATPRLADPGRTPESERPVDEPPLPY